MVKDFSSSEKKIYDPIHGFIRFDEFEKDLIDSLPFQRLHYIHQLGIAYLVYPGATHSRFEHSLGVMELSSQIYDKICGTVRPDLFSFVPRTDSLEYAYWKKVLRFASLCHDVGHLPFSHVAEAALLGDLGHEKWTLKIIESPFLESVWDKIEAHPWFEGTTLERNFREDVAKIAVGEKKYNQLFSHEKKNPFSSWEKILSQIINGEFFGADRIDYLLRDSRCTGIAYGLFDYLQLIETLMILPSVHQKDTLELGVDENGLDSCEALLLARHFMHRRVYQYSSIKAYSFHLRRFLQMLASQGMFSDVHQFVCTNDVQVMALLQKAAMDITYPGHDDAKKIMTRKNRFKAFILQDFLKKEDLVDFQKNHGIESHFIGWEFNDPLLEKMDLSFPVSRRHLVVEEARQCAPLLANLPSICNNWVYIAPEYELLFLQFIKKKMEER
ncbi:MAG: HD domain-containing protein [Chlamydiota bacterium]